MDYIGNNWGGNELDMKNPLTGNTVPMAVTKFVGDTTSKIVAPATAIPMAIKKVSEEFGAQLQKEGCAQNEDKQVHMVKMVGTGSQREMKRCYANEAGMPGRV
eukprot:9718562-Lingulodinium_polyedra.AAC.1